MFMVGQQGEGIHKGCPYRRGQRSDGEAGMENVSGL